MKKLYKKLIISFFRLYYGQLTIYTGKKFLKKKNFFINRLIKFYEIDNARVFTNTNHVSVIKDNKIIQGPSLQIENNGLNSNINKNFSVNFGTPKFYKEYNCRVFSLLCGVDANNNYYHWFFDSLSRFFIFKKYYKFNKNDFFLIHNLKHDFQIQSLKLLGIRNIINSYNAKHIKAKKIICINFVRQFNLSFQKWIINYLKKFLLKKNNKINKKKIKIFIDRTGIEGSYRGIANRDEFINFLKTKNFIILDPSKLKFLDEIKIFKSADIVIGIYGAGLTNMIFCKKNTKVIEIKPYYIKDNLYKDMAINCNLKYSLIRSKIINKSETNRSYDGQLYVSTKKLKKLINSHN